MSCEECRVKGRKPFWSSVKQDFSIKSQAKEGKRWVKNAKVWDMSVNSVFWNFVFLNPLAEGAKNGTEWNRMERHVSTCGKEVERKKMWCARGWKKAPENGSSFSSGLLFLPAKNTSDVHASCFLSFLLHILLASGARLDRLEVNRLKQRRRGIFTWRKRNKSNVSSLASHRGMMFTLNSV